jgi:hypothetical protein
MSIPGDLPDTSKNSFVFSDFSGGMRRNVDPTGIEDNEYALLINGRNRFGNVAPINGPLELTNQLPSGFYQNVYGFESILLLFIDGKAFAKDFKASSGFVQIPGIQMTETAPEIFVEAVPSSWMNAQRKATASDQNAEVTFFSQVSGTPSALVVQDGIIQPMLIFSTGNARQAKTSIDWSDSELLGEDRREYVPKGKQMCYQDGRLYIVSSDGYTIYRSVTGRPLDFVIAIDTDGHKLPPLTSGVEEANRLSYNLDYSPITCLKAIAAKPRVSDEEEGFFVGTLKRSWIVFPHFRNTVFAEPRFSNQVLFPTGPLNQYSFTELLGDTAIISEAGVTTFNSIFTIQNEGRNAPFHDKIFKLFELGKDQIKQTITCAITSDNYAFFGMDTIYGPAVLVYDTQREAWSSVDIYPNLKGKIKQFAEIKLSGQRYLFFITSGNQLFEAFAGEALEYKVYGKEVQSEDAEIDLIPKRFRLVLDEIVKGGDVSVTIYSNGKAGTRMTKTIDAPTTTDTIPIEFPFGDAKNIGVVKRTFTVEEGIKGDRIGYFLECSAEASIQRIEIILESEERQVSEQEMGNIFEQAKTL